VIEPTGPLPRSVYWRRRVLAIGGSALAVAVIAWVIGGFGEPDPAAVRDSATGSSRPAATSAGTVSAPATTRHAPSSAKLPATSTPPAQPPQVCPDAALGVLAETGAPAYPVGQRPLLRLVVVNTGPVPCLREVSRSLRELVITTGDGATRLWSSNDCYAPPGVDTRLLKPGERLSFTVGWAGRTSAPGCPATRDPVPAGHYLVTGRLGSLAGPPVPLQLT
jgi:hypothetical protein